MSEPFLSEIKIVSFSFPPKGWAFCNGQLLPINQNQALFSLLGTTYGGDGRVNFALPDLRGRVPISFGAGFTLGERGGEVSHNLTISEMPPHAHATLATPKLPSAPSPAGNLWTSQSSNAYSPSANVSMNPASITPSGGSQPHQNMSPYLVLTFVIALQGIFPSQS